MLTLDAFSEAHQSCESGVASPSERFAETDTLEFAQEFLSEMLVVKRTSVTLHAHTLQRAGLIKYSRGKIQIADVEAMRDTVCECYETVKSHYRALPGHPPS